MVPPTRPRTRTTTPTPQLPKYTAQQKEELAKRSKILSQVSDPGLPPIVGRVNGSPIQAQTEAVQEWLVIHSDPKDAHERIGSTTLRSQAFTMIVQNMVAEQKAQSMGLLPNKSYAKAQIMGMGLKVTSTRIQAYQFIDGSQILMQQIIKNHGQSGWTHDIHQWVKNAQVKNFLS